MSFKSIDKSREVHVSRLHDQFDRAGIASTMVETLGTLEFLREAESLGGGYWIPAPIRAIDLDGNLCLLVGIHPTDELRRHFSSARRAGAGRVVNASEVPGLPKQSLSSWRGYDGCDATVWAQKVIESAIEQFSPSVSDERMQIFGTNATKGASGRREPTWVRIGDSAACVWRGVGLFRAPTSGTRYRYFLGRYRSKSEFLEGPPGREPLRMQFGITALQGQALTINVVSRRDIVSITLPLRAPTALRRLLVALCDEDAQSFGRTWICRNPGYLFALQASLSELGCETSYHE